MLSVTLPVINAVSCRFYEIFRLYGSRYILPNLELAVDRLSALAEGVWSSLFVVNITEVAHLNEPTALWSPAAVINIEMACLPECVSRTSAKFSRFWKIKFFKVLVTFAGSSKISRNWRFQESNQLRSAFPNQKDQAETRLPKFRNHWHLLYKFGCI